MEWMDRIDQMERMEWMDRIDQMERMDRTVRMPMGQTVLMGLMGQDNRMRK